jgi:hypothetical protein
VKHHAPWIIAAVATVSLLVAGCSASPMPHSGASASLPTASATPSTLGAGFWDPMKPPAPEGTITPAPNSWSNAHPPAGYSVVLLTYGNDAQTRTLVRAVRSWAKDEDVALDTVVATSGDDLLDATSEAITRKPDLVISVGNALVDALAAITPGVLRQQFLVVGAEVAEPTANVTAADWTGAGFRGEGLGTPTEYNAKSFTAARAGRAIRAGIAAIVNGLTGIVVWVD